MVIKYLYTYSSLVSLQQAEEMKETGYIIA